MVSGVDSDTIAVVNPKTATTGAIIGISAARRPLAYMSSRIGSARTPIPIPAGSAISIDILITALTALFMAPLSLTAHASESAGRALTPSDTVIIGTRFLKSIAVL